MRVCEHDRFPGSKEDPHTIAPPALQVTGSSSSAGTRTSSPGPRRGSVTVTGWKSGSFAMSLYPALPAAAGSGLRETSCSNASKLSLCCLY